ncbi:hypothetical protein NDU88_007195 [Pleurodeles waltl]|uniref:Uncharacterized protein n=1 Tax=Pleurodeles waltl TaxID=8319 RepID=A0AAV7RUB3_PLEWA|nr:hypothetical protein NDU88_007195 [Pleurodeles waltl]
MGSIGIHKRVQTGVELVNRGEVRIVTRHPVLGSPRVREFPVPLAKIRLVMADSEASFYEEDEHSIMTLDEELCEAVDASIQHAVSLALAPLQKKLD